MGHLKLFSDYKALEREIDRLERLPDLKAKGLLDGALTISFEMTQGAVHIITGSLKSSGKKSSHIDGDTWEGEIVYGGVSLGVNNPVTYAIYEKARDGAHDFFTPLKGTKHLFTKAIIEGMKS